MDHTLHINVASAISKLLNSREEATELLSNPEILNANVLELDFSEVDFMSRSFADQLHKDKIVLFEKYSIETIFLNANSEIIEMMKAVANTQSKARTFHSISKVKFDNIEDLKNHLWGF